MGKKHFPRFLEPKQSLYKKTRVMNNRPFGVMVGDIATGAQGPGFNTLLGQIVHSVIPLKIVPWQFIGPVWPKRY